MIEAGKLRRVRDILKEWRQAGLSIGLVPTMGYFHDGHIALMKNAAEISDRVVVSLFVNPTQFGPEEDLEVYPRDFAGDCKKAAGAGVDLLFNPEISDVYGPHHQTLVSVTELTKGHCGQDRPGHFQGVTTVVAKLFNMVQPDVAIFGEKDYQQLMAIKRMAADLNFPVTVLGHPIVRETDGLAMSSRNAYLTGKERHSALVLYRALNDIRQRVISSEHDVDVDKLVDQAKNMISSEDGCSLEYFEIVNGDSFKKAQLINEDSRAIGAIRINERIRLIDNMAIGSPAE